MGGLSIFYGARVKLQYLYPLCFNTIRLVSIDYSECLNVERM